MKTTTILLEIFFLLAHIFLLNFSAAQIQDSIGFNGEERDALYALKSTLNNPFLNSNWCGIHCYKNQTPLWYGIQCLDGQVTALLLESIGLTGNISSMSFEKFHELSVISIKNNFLSGDIVDLSLNQKLKSIDLSHNEFSGPIPESLLTLNFLESLQLQDNKLTGSVPGFNQSTLKVFNVSKNNLTGSIPTTQALLWFEFDSFFDNQGLCGKQALLQCKDSVNNTAATSQDDSNKDASNHIGSLLLVLVLVVCLVAILLLFILYQKKARILKKVMRHVEGSKLIKEKEKEEKAVVGPEGREEKETREDDVVVEERGKLKFIDEERRSDFDLDDLLKASAEGLGKGIFGTTYKAMLVGKPPSVVKRLRDLKPMSMDDFAKQIRFISQLRHPHLLPLLAYYYAKDEKLLLYKFAVNGNLFNRLIDGRVTQNRVPFRWNARLSVARGIARALEYLHLNTRSDSIVPHGNLKSSNVLLDENDKVLVSDFGLASLIAHPIAVQRLAAYKSPEFRTMSKVSKKSDIWSYGCLLFELLTGKISAHSAPPGFKGVELNNWVHRAVREEWTAEIFDVEILVQRSATPGMLRLLQIAMRCCDNSPEKRPEIFEVVREVESIKVREEDDEDDLSLEQSLIDESGSYSASGIVPDERYR